MLTAFFCFVLLFQSLVSSPPTSENDYLVRHFTAEDSLPVNAVSDIAQDENGYLYFATLNGLARFDGYQFETFNTSNSPGILTNRFSGMMMTSAGDIWLPTESGPLTLYQNNTFTTFTEEDGVEGQNLSIEEGVNGELLISTSAGIKKLDSQAGRFVTLHPELEVETWVIKSQANGGLLAVNHHGIVQYENGEVQVLLEPKDMPIQPERVMELNRFSDGTIWIMATIGFFIFHPNKGIIHSYQNNQPPGFICWNVYKTNEGSILSTTQGFFRVDPKNFSLSRLPVKTDPVINRPNTIISQNNQTVFFGDEVAVNDRIIFETEAVKTGLVDREGSIWVASERNGLYQLRKSIISNITLVDSKSIENIYPIIQDSNGDIWAGSLLSGVYRFKDTETDFWHGGNSSLNTTQVRFLYEDNDGTIYMGLWGDGLWRFENNDWVRMREFDHLFDNSITIEAMYRDINDTMIIGTRSQTVLERNGRYQLMQDSLGTGLEGVRVIRESNDETLFFGTNGQGLGILDSSGDLKTITKSNGLPSNFIRDIHIQSQDTLWIATEDLGLARVILNSEKNVQSIQSVRTKDGLMDNSLHRIIADRRNNYWISSNSGVMKISRRELNAYADGNRASLPVISYNQRDGMVNPEANGGVQTAGVLTNDNKIWFPNQKGITVFDLTESDSVERNGTIQPQIQNIILPDSVLFASNDQTISLPEGERNVSITFTAPNFAYPERVKFRYRLSGVSDDWIPANESREAVFTNLDPGTHRFEIQANPGNGELSTASIFVTVPSFFYETYWFYVMMICFGGLLIYGGFKYRTRTLVMRERELQKRVDAQTKELKEAAEQKSRFFSGITHELKTPLSLILGPIDDLAESKKPANWKNVQNRIKMMQRNGYRLQNLIDQILDVTKLNAEAIQLIIQPVDFEKLSRQILGQFQSRLIQKKINLKIRSDKIDSPVYLDQDAWERILINLMSNAIKFSPLDSEIQITIKNNENKVSLSVKDQGEGIKPEDQQQVFEYLYQAKGSQSAEGTGIGLFLVKGLVEQMGGEIELISKEGEGSEFIVSLKKGSAHFRDEDQVLHNPVSISDEPVPVLTEETDRIKTEPKPSPAGDNHILVVEDNDDFRSYLQSILSDEHRVSTASEGTLALKVLESESPDLIISDVMMPGMNGLEFVNSLREKKQFKHLPVLFLSAKNHETDIEAGLSTGADIYLTKPIKSKMLLAQVNAILRRENVLKNQEINKTENNEPELVSEIRTIVYRQMANSALNVTMLADALFMSRSKLYEEWKKVSDMTINDFIKSIRLQEGKILIKEKGFGIQETAHAVGYSNSDYFSTSFKQQFGVSPSQVK
ncbi:ATP-binding protein [Rhodohalobacter sp. 614A]|uniref:ATP-binding protein n=1 Tax=Rhodohalobacter sp. 614A TaxID=2908649 RepID=UPI001F310482|nr:ATP-binding protein [Rhodohalobacter sp. 614A]